MRGFIYGIKGKDMMGEGPAFRLYCVSSTLARSAAVIMRRTACKLLLYILVLNVCTPVDMCLVMLYCAAFFV